MALPCLPLYTFRTTATETEQRPRQFSKWGWPPPKETLNIEVAFSTFFLLTKERDTDKSCFFPIVLLCSSIFSSFYVWAYVTIETQLGNKDAETAPERTGGPLTAVSLGVYGWHRVQGLLRPQGTPRSIANNYSEVSRFRALDALSFIRKLNIF